MADIKKEIEELRKKIAGYQKAYYIDSKPLVSDKEYDLLFDRLVSLEKDYPQYDDPFSPAKRVGSDLSQDFPFFTHKIPVLSLDKCYSVEELRTWIDKTKKATHESISFVIEEKIDGASIVLYYEKGRLVNAVTRGNGSIGNDVTGNVKTIKTVPLILPEPVTLTCRGEIYLTKTVFNKINNEMEVPYANPRNLASGTLRRLKSSETARIPLDIFIYEGFFEDYKPTDSLFDDNEHIKILEKLSGLGFKLNQNNCYITAKKPDSKIKNFIKVMGPDELEDYITRQINNRQSKDYEIDGLVVKVNEIEERESLGYTGHHPRWAIAFKFESPGGITQIEDIVVQVGRTGRLTPVASVKPVEISGSTISRVTLHNQEYINALEIGIGDTVVVEKRGDVIPSVTSLVEHGENKPFRIPLNCPECNFLVVEKGAHLFCENKECPAVIKGRLIFFVSKSQMDIENLGQETITFLYANKMISDIPGIYELDLAPLAGYPGFGDKKVKLIADGIAKSRTKPYEVVLPSLGIPDLGHKMTELLIESGIDNIDALLEIALNNDTGRLIRIPGIGEKTAASVLSELRKEETIHMIQRLKQAGLQFQAEKKQTSDGSGIFAGQVWCATGSFEFFKPRSLAMDEVKKRGGKVVTSVTSVVTHLLAGEEAGSKLEKASKLGITVVTENEFIGMLKKE